MLGFLLHLWKFFPKLGSISVNSTQSFRRRFTRERYNNCSPSRIIPSVISHRFERIISARETNAFDRLRGASLTELPNNFRSSSRHEITRHYIAGDGHAITWRTTFAVVRPLPRWRRARLRRSIKLLVGAFNFSEKIRTIRKLSLTWCYCSPVERSLAWNTVEELL